VRTQTHYPAAWNRQTCADACIPPDARSNLASNNLVGVLPTSLNKTVSFPALATLCVRLARTQENDWVFYIGNR
jgi:hypothetical protein